MNVWVEITKSEHMHGGNGWEFGTCLWSPSRNRAGGDRYSLMRRPQKGDRVLHFYNDRWPDGIKETRVSGHSVVKKPYHLISNSPPMPGDWANMAPYYRVDLEHYTPFTAPLPLSELLTIYGNEVRHEIIETRPKFYPFTTHGNTVRTVQGIYLSRCTDNLNLLIEKALGVEETVLGKTTSDKQQAHEEYAEGMRYSRERHFWARNPALSRRAKEHYGLTCQACGFNFTAAYGKLAEGYIECHHLNPISERPAREWTQQITTSIEDVRVLCANCHRVVHRFKPALSIDTLIAAIGKSKAV